MGWLKSVLAIGSMMTAAPAPAAVEAELQRFVADYQQDPQIQDISFGVEIGGETWTVEARKSNGPNPPSAKLRRGEPNTPTIVWTMSLATFESITSRQISAMTNNGAAFATDITPLDYRPINGFKPDASFYQNVYRSLIFHFWTIGKPEIVAFGFPHARKVHGGRAVPTFYGPGIRTSWYGILPGDHINENPRSQTDPWSSAFFIIKGGTAKARIGDQIIDLRDNTMIHIPPETRHEFWNDGDTPGEMIMVTFGKDS